MLIGFYIFVISWNFELKDELIRELFVRVEKPEAHNCTLFDSLIEGIASLLDAYLIANMILSREWCGCDAVALDRCAIWIGVDEKDIIFAMPIVVFGKRYCNIPFEWEWILNGIAAFQGSPLAVAYLNTLQITTTHYSQQQD